VEGTPEAILGLQNSSMHYYQRPDADHVELKSRATSLSGWGGQLTFAKEGGNTLCLVSSRPLPRFDPNDVGFQYSSSDVINFQILPATLG